MRLGSYSEGLRRLQKAIRLNPRHVKAHEALASLYEQMGSTAQAAEHRRLARETGGEAPKE